MSWDYNLLIEFNEGQLPYEFASDVVTVVFRNPAFKGINLVEVHEGSFIKYDTTGNVSRVPLEKIEAQDGTLDINEVMGVLNKAQRNDVLVIMRIVVPRYARTGAKIEQGNSNHIDDDFGEVIHQDENVFLSIFGENFEGYPKEFTGRNAAGAIYNARSGDKYNVRRRGEDAYNNLRYVINELDALVPYGINTISALDRENSRETTTSSLKFHHELIQFVDDIRQSNHKTQEKFSPSDVLAAIYEAGDVELFNSELGLFIYSKFGIAGNLSRFYEILQSKVTM